MLAGRYRLSGLLGRGGMGTVWRAHDEHLDREVAVKELRLPEDLDPVRRESWTARLDREARAAARLKHPGVITVHDRVTDEDGRPWIVMELVHGPSLDDLVKAEGPLPPERVARIGLQVLDALRAVHGMGITHRDIKPANVLLEGERVVLTDFGIAALEGDVTLTRSGALLGTPVFMAPEQVHGLAATAESDLWSLGATLFTAVEGRPPFAGSGAVAVFVAVATEEPAPAVLAGPLAPVLAGLLRKDPAERLTAEAAHRLLRALADAPAPPPPSPTLAFTGTGGSGGAGEVGEGGPGARPEAESGAAARNAGNARRPGRPGVVAVLALALVLVGVLAWAPWRESGHDGLADSPGAGSSARSGPSASPSPSPPASATPSATPPSSSSPSSSPPGTSPAAVPGRPAHTPLDRAAIDRVVTTYMNGLADQDMTALRRGTCPRLRSTLLGFALNGYYVARWELRPYEVPASMDQLSIEARITQQDPETGGLAGDIDYQWIVERDAGGDYWVCGWLNGR